MLDHYKEWTLSIDPHPLSSGIPTKSGASPIASPTCSPTTCRQSRSDRCSRRFPPRRRRSGWRRAAAGTALPLTRFSTSSPSTIAPLSLRQWPPALLGLGQFAAGGDRHFRRGARRGDEPERGRRQSRRRPSRTPGRAMVRRARSGCRRRAMGLLVSGGSMANLTALAAARHAKAGFDVRAHAGCSPAMRAARRLHVRGGPRLHPQSGRTARTRQRVAARDSRQRALRDARRRARRRDRSAISMTAAADRGGRERRHGEHRRYRSDSRDRACLPRSPRLAARRRRLRRRGHPLARATATPSSRWRSPTASRSIRTNGSTSRSKRGSCWFGTATTLRSAFSLVPPYLRTDGDPRGVGGPPWFSEFGFQQSRGFRALKVWMALKYYGIDGLRERASITTSTWPPTSRSRHGRSRARADGARRR